MKRRKEWILTKLCPTEGDTEFCARYRILRGGKKSNDDIGVYRMSPYMAMATHPTGETVDIVGINCGDNGHSCEEFPVYVEML